MGGLEIISPDELDRYVHRADVLIIDLREQGEYSRGHIEGAVSMPYDSMDKRISLPGHKLLVLYCDRGSASLAKGRELAERGYRVMSVAGGIHAYRGRYYV